VAIISNNKQDGKIFLPERIREKVFHASAPGKRFYGIFVAVAILLFLLGITQFREESVFHRKGLKCGKRSKKRQKKNTANKRG